MFFIVVLWLFIATILSFDNSIALLEKRNIPLDSFGGFSVSSWRIKEVVNNTDDIVLQEKLNLILKRRKISKFMFLIWGLFVLSIIIFS